jgi:heat shock protein HslJ
MRHLIVNLIALALAAALASCGGNATSAEPSATAPLGGALETTTDRPASDLADTEWVLTSLRGQPPTPGSQISLRFEGDRFSSFAGCNTLAGRYKAIDAGTLGFPELERTMELCPELEGVMEQEEAYVDAFVITATYRLTRDRLELLDATGQAVLVYERLSLGSTEGALPGTKWVLTSLRGQPPLSDTHISLEFEDQSFGGYTGCNYYGGGPDSGGYAATDDGNLKLLSFEVTLIGCPDSIAAQEKAYIDALTSVRFYRLVANRLELRDATDEVVLIYTRRAECAEEPASLAGTAWYLVSVDGREPTTGPATLLVFVDDKWFVESSQCEGFISSYQISGHDLAAAFSASLGRVCQDEESHGVTALEVPADYCLAQGSLQITTVPGQVFAYEPLPEAAQPPLEGPTWLLLSIVGARQIEGEPVPWPEPVWLVEGTEITLAFEGGTVSGSAGCNDYGAAYTLDGTSLEFGDIAATEKACLTPEGVMDQEQRYLGALEDVTDYRISGTLLWLWTKDRRALAFTAQGPKKP